MYKTTSPWALVLLTGLLSACDKAPESVAAQGTLSQDSAISDAAALDRKLDAAQIARGSAIFEKNCAECHGANGKGQPGDWRIRDADGKYPPPPLDDSAHAWHHPTKVLMEAIRDGSPGGEGNMPAWKDKLSEQEMQDTVVYIKSLWTDPVYRLWLKLEQQSLEP
ncbi:MAG: c-type cytochrome [Thiobacillus sp.]|nr:c-type cytochrome [Thiobacillus sp.]